MSPSLVAATVLPQLRSRLSSVVLSCSYSSKTSTHQGKKSGSGGANPSTTSTSLDGKKLDPPPNVFKEVNPKDLGPGAAKDKDYKNPEYFSYHTMSYADMDIVMNKLRGSQPSSLKK